MERRKLGSTGLEVSLLGMGTLPLGPLQAGLSLAEGSSLIREALARGINFLDTAELYETYGYIGQALKGCSTGPLVASKSYAVTAEEMEESIRRALRETGMKTLGLFMLHQQESALTLKGHRGAVEYMAQAKRDGIIKSTGISTHHIAAVKAAADMPEIDVIFAPLNERGLGIMDGTVRDMIGALEEAYERGKGILVMKPLGGGHLWKDAERAFSFLQGFPFISSIVTGMQNADELAMDCALVACERVPGEIKDRVRRKPRNIHIEDCQGCGRCVAACPSGALSLVKGIATVSHDLCVKCGYCAPRCPEFCIKLL